MTMNATRVAGISAFKDIVEQRGHVLKCSANHACFILKPPVFSLVSSLVLPYNDTAKHDDVILRHPCEACHATNSVSIDTVRIV